MHFRVVDDKGRPLATGRDLIDLQRRLADKAAASFSETAGNGFERTGLKRWRVGDVDTHIAFEQGGVTLRGYPALVDDGASVSLRLLDSLDEAEAAHRTGVRRLAMLALPDQAKHLRRSLAGLDRLTLLHQSVGGGGEALRTDLQAAVFDQLFEAAGVPRERHRFEALIAAYREAIIPAGERLVTLATTILERHHQLRKRLKGAAPLAEMAARRDIEAQLQALIYPGFILRTPSTRLSELPRYLDGIDRRLTRIARAPGRDDEPRLAIERRLDKYHSRCAQHQRKGIHDPTLEAFGWLLEEYRISLFAQDLGTREKVSEKRLDEAWASVR